jgi:hypothetical protein
MRWTRGLPALLTLTLLIGAACEPDKDSAVKADGPADVEAETTTTAPPTTTTTAPPPTTTGVTAAPATTPTTAKPVAAAPATTAKPATTTTARPRTTTTAAAVKSGSCHGSYTGTCIPPDVSDADCAGGSGNGPHYVREKNIGVVGPDVFDLDRDGDGVGCES